MDKPLKCPYVLHSKTIRQDTYEYNASGQLVFNQSLTTDHPLLADCLREACAKFEDGKCKC